MRALSKISIKLLTRFMLCCAMLCYAMLCYATLCYVMLCYAMLCNSVCWKSRFFLTSKTANFPKGYWEINKNLAWMIFFICFKKKWEGHFYFSKFSTPPVPPPKKNSLSFTLNCIDSKANSHGSVQKWFLNQLLYEENVKPTLKCSSNKPELVVKSKTPI